MRSVSFRVCTNGNEEFAQHVLPWLPRGDGGAGLRLKGADARAASAVRDGGMHRQTSRRTDPQQGPRMLQEKDVTGEFQQEPCKFPLTLYRGCHDNPIHLKLGVSPTRRRSGEKGTGELRARVLVLQFNTSSAHVPRFNPSAEAGFKRLELKNSCSGIFNCSSFPPHQKAFIYLKGSLCPLWPHLAICCTCNGFSLIWPNWSCWNPAWDRISTVNLGAPACKACQMLWVGSHPVHYTHFQEKKRKCFFFLKKKMERSHSSCLHQETRAARKDVAQLCLLCVMSEEACSQANCIISVHRQNSQMNKLINERNLNQKQAMKFQRFSPGTALCLC